jgi:hypothetical protein
MKERQIRIIIIHAARIETPLLQPPIRRELTRIRAPQMWRAIYGPRNEKDTGPFGNKLGSTFYGNGGVADGAPGGEGYGGVEAEGFLDDGVEDGEVVYLGRGWGFAGGKGGKVGADFGAKGGLPLWIDGEEVDGPC